ASQRSARTCCYAVASPETVAGRTPSRVERAACKVANSGGSADRLTTMETVRLRARSMNVTWTILNHHQLPCVTDRIASSGMITSPARDQPIVIANLLSETTTLFGRAKLKPPEITPWRP